ncbi:MAG: winged helix-turn-helix transcriptional regulator [Oscillospiraceae bacterium]|nr:winged helix-turn-helix transcriptional regulator [Oscillospiraceae bacterium]
MNYEPETVAWVKLPLELLKRQGVSQKAAVLLSVIIDKCKQDKASLSAPISSAELVSRSGMSRATVCRALNELRALDLIESTRTGRESVYRLTAGCVELCPKAVKDEHPKGTPRGSAPRSRTKKPTAAEMEKMSKYLQFVNRFKEDEQNETENLH